MNLNIITINVIVSILVVENHGGLIDGVYGRVQNTTRGLQQDVKNVWSFTKGLVVGEDETPGVEHKEEERGFIGGNFHSVHEKVHSFREHIWDVNDIPNDSGILWNMWRRLKERLSRAKSYIFGNSGNKADGNTQAPNEEAELIANTMNMLFFPNGTRRIDEIAFKEAVENLRKKLGEMQKNEENPTTAPNRDGEGLIDVRMGEGHINEDSKNEDAAASVGNDIYDRVDDGISNLKHETSKTILAINDNTIENVNNGMESMRSGLNTMGAKTNELKEKASDAVAKEKDLLDSTNQKLNKNAKNLGDNVKQAAADMNQFL